MRLNHIAIIASIVFLGEICFAQNTENLQWYNIKKTFM